MHYQHALSVGTLVLMAVLPVTGQTSPDVSGHWKVSIDTPDFSSRAELDVAKDADGRFGGTVTIPSEKITGLPLLVFAVESNHVAFHARSDQPFVGTVSSDGALMAGTYSVGGFELPFTATRTGAAKIDPPLKSPGIGRELEGRWNGTVEASGARLTVVLKVEPHTDAPTARLVVTDQGGLEIPVAIQRNGPNVTLQSTVVPLSFAGALNAAGTELKGTYVQGAFKLPAVFERDLSK